MKRPYVLAAISGILYGLAFPPTGFPGSLLGFICLVPLLIALETGTRLRDAFRRGFVAMFLLGLVANYWVGGWKGIGAVDPFLMVGGVILALIHPFFLVVPLLLYDVVRRKYGAKPALYALPILWTGFEYFHSLGDLSYPWLNLYNTQSYNLPYIQFIEYTGSFGASFLLVAVNALIYVLLRARREAVSGLPTELVVSAKGKRLAVVSLSLAIGLPYLHGAIVMSQAQSSERTLRVTIIQPNINPWAKWEVSQKGILDTNFEATDAAIARDGKADLVIWPETAITFPITLNYNGEHLLRLYDYLDRIRTPLLTGFPQVEEYMQGKDSIPPDAKPSKYDRLFYRSWNAAMVVYRGAEGYEQDHYYKQRLVPWGEKVPFVDIFPVLGDIFKWSVGLGSWNEGTGFDVQRLPMRAVDSTAPVQDTARMWTMICYESVYPWFVREFVKNGAEMLVIITNDGWYGRSSGPYQHNQFAVLRAIENRRWIARSANTGISSVIDDKGRMIRETDLFVKDAITSEIPLRAELTVYASVGDWVAIPCMWITGGFAVFSLVLYYRHRRRPRTS